jgi:hypothetical protein
MLTKGGLQYNWQINGADCRAILEAALPYLVTKRRQAELGLALIDTLRPRTDRSRLTESELLIKQTIAEELRSMSSKGDNTTETLLHVQ